MRYRNYGKRNNSFGGYFANELYKGLKQNQNGISLTNEPKPKSLQKSLDSDGEKTSYTKQCKKLIFITLCCILILCISIPFIVSYFEKQRIIDQVISLSEQNGLENVEIEYIKKDSEYGWYDVSIKCSNFSNFSFEEMQNIENAISKEYKIFTESFISGGKKYVVFDDSIYIDGERFPLEKEPEKTYRYWHGMNGSWTYRCEKNCDDTCKYCRDCINESEMYDDDCTFQYSAKSPIGWIGCPKCGDVDNSYWHKWYDEKLKS